MNLRRVAVVVAPLLLMLAMLVPVHGFYSGVAINYFVYDDHPGIEDWVFTGEGYYLSSEEAVAYGGYYGWYTSSGVLDWKYIIVLQPSGSYNFELYMSFASASSMFSVPPGTSRFYVFDEFYGEVDFSTRTLRVFCGGYEWSGSIPEPHVTISIYVSVAVRGGSVDESGSIVYVYGGGDHYVPCGFERFVGRELSLRFESTEMIHQLLLYIGFPALSSGGVLVVPEVEGARIVPKEWSPLTCECPEEQSTAGRTVSWIVEDKRLLAVIGGAVVLLLLLGLAAGRRRR